MSSSSNVDVVLAKERIHHDTNVMELPTASYTHASQIEELKDFRRCCCQPTRGRNRTIHPSRIFHAVGFYRTSRPDCQKEERQISGASRCLPQIWFNYFIVGNETTTLEAASNKILGKKELPQHSPDATVEEMQNIRNSKNRMIKKK